MSKYLPILLVFLTFVSCNSSKKQSVTSYKHTNALSSETSPYLLQHAHNPVDWNPWNEEVLQKAKDENKLLIISIGYAACHWCHVMEKESFEDSTVAAVMNQNFISIKVDREERPDIDQVYINAVQLMTGSAGWPLNVITLPDGRPVWGGTYFKKNDWINSIEQIQALYKTDPEKLIAYATRLEEGIKSMDIIERNTDDAVITNFNAAAAIDSLELSFDPQYGGTKKAPKFMMPNSLEYLLRKGVRTNNRELIVHVTNTLDKMAYGGLYDAIGGGFARYSVDEKWHVPHFEKMLYDNAQLVSLYSKAYSLTKNPLYKDIVTETLTYIAREMTSTEGAFYSSLDADSTNENGELEEGAFYIYTKKELQQILSTDFELFSAYYNVNDFGKWEDHYVLIRTESDSTIAKIHKISIAQLQEKKTSWRHTLLEYRNQRPKPRLDDKTLTSWNALMLKGYVDAYKAFQNSDYLDAALKNANFIKNKQFQSDKGLFHSYKEGASSINGYLEDYAGVTEAYIALYEVTMDSQWLEISKQLVDYSVAHFYDEEKGMFYFTSNKDTKLVTRTIEYRDNVISSSNSIMAKNLFKLSHYFDAPNYRSMSDQMLKNILPDAKKYPGVFPNWLDLLENHQFNYYEIVVSGKNASKKLIKLNQMYLPNALIAGSEKESNSYLLEGRFPDDETLIYVCVNNACRLPVTTVEKALETLKISE
jgi:uncharacterized protein YyaL (SSP411 family)